VREAVGQTNIEYPAVLDNDYAISDVYGQHFWPASYLINVDSFVRYEHFPEGAYDETDQKVQKLLAERDRISYRSWDFIVERVPQDGIVGDVTT